MNAERLLALYETVAEAPDAVVRLRRFVLDLAVRGKLEAQEPGDVSPVKLLAEARKQLRAQAETAKRMRWKQTDPVAVDEIDRDVPSGWVAARVNDTGLYINGLAFKPADWKQSGIPIIRIQNLTDPQKEFNYAQGDFPDEVMVRDGDLLVSWSATLEAFMWDRGEGVLNQHIFRVIPHEGITDRGFLLLLLRHAIREMADSEHAHGLVMAHINRGPFLNHVVLIPPLAEQRRIVAKVEELMALLDRLEAARTAREATRDRLTAASLARLTAPDANPAAFPANARFALATLPALTARPDQIKPLRQTILNLAVRGKLVEQDPTDETASELLKRIAPEVEKKRTGRGRRAKPLPAVDPADAPFELPDGWAWARFPEIGNFGRGKSKHRPRNDPALYADGTHLMIQTGDVARSGGKITTFTNKYNDVGLAQSMLWPKGTLCITIAANIADSGILDFDACFPDSVVGFVPASVFENASYFEYFVRTAKANLLEFAPSTAQKNINLEILTSVLIPLPPLAEQHRIVAKVDALMALCDRLEASLTTTATTRSKLLNALLHEALEPATDAITEAAE